MGNCCMISERSYRAPPDENEDDADEDASSAVSSDEDMDDDPLVNIDSSAMDEVEVDDVHFSS